MEDEEEDSPLPTEIQDADRVRQDMPLIHTMPRCQLSGSASNAVSPLHRAVGLGLVPTSSAEDSQVLLQSLIFPERDAGFVPYCSTEPEELDGEQQDARRVEETEEEGQERTSVEVQIGQKLREIGDRFQREHIDQFMQHQRDQLPVWWHVVNTLYNIIFSREVFRHDGGHR